MNTFNRKSFLVSVLQVAVLFSHFDKFEFSTQSNEWFETYNGVGRNFSTLALNTTLELSSVCELTCSGKNPSKQSLKLSNACHLISRYTYILISIYAGLHAYIYSCIKLTCNFFSRIIFFSSKQYVLIFFILFFWERLSRL